MPAAVIQSSIATHLDTDMEAGLRARQWKRRKISDGLFSTTLRLMRVYRRGVCRIVDGSMRYRLIMRRNRTFIYMLEGGWMDVLCMI